MHRRVARTQFSAVWWGPCERLEPSLIIFAFTLLLMAKAKEVPAAVSPRVSARRVPLRPEEAFECCGSVHRRGSSAHVRSSQSFALRHVFPLTGYLIIPSGAKVLQGTIPDLGN